MADSNSIRTVRSRAAAVEAGALRLSGVIRDPAAVTKLSALIEKHGSQRAAIEWLLSALEQAPPPD